MAGSYNTIAAEVLGDFFRSLCKDVLNVPKKMAKKRFKNPGRALGIATNVATSFAP